MPSPHNPSGLPRTHEVDYRLSGYLGGLPVRLADGGEWVFAGPEEVDAAEPDFRAELIGLLTAIVESEDAAERSRGELALGIHLLAVNYDLSPDDFSRLLSFPPRDPRLDVFQASLRDLSRRHREALRPPAERSPVTARRRFHFPTFSRRRHAANSHPR